MATGRNLIRVGLAILPSPSIPSLFSVWKHGNYRSEGQQIPLPIVNLLVINIYFKFILSNYSNKFMMIYLAIKK